MVWLTSRLDSKWRWHYPEDLYLPVYVLTLAVRSAQHLPLPRSAWILETVRAHGRTWASAQQTVASDLYVAQCVPTTHTRYDRCFYYRAYAENWVLGSTLYFIWVFYINSVWYKNRKDNGSLSFNQTVCYCSLAALPVEWQVVGDPGSDAVCYHIH